MYGLRFQDRLRVLEIEDVLIAPRSPWQSPYVERIIGTLRRDCLDHVIIISESRLRRIVRQFLTYYHGTRMCLALDNLAERLNQSISDLGIIKVKPLVT